MLPFSCPLSAAKTGKERRTTAQSEGVERTDLVSIRPWSGKDQQGLAKRGYARFFWLRTRRSQVRVANVFKIIRETVLLGVRPDPSWPF